MIPSCVTYTAVALKAAHPIRRNHVFTCRGMCRSTSGMAYYLALHTVVAASPPPGTLSLVSLQPGGSFMTGLTPTSLTACTACVCAACTHNASSPCRTITCCSTIDSDNATLAV